jgi:hypothetical protein
MKVESGRCKYLCSMEALSGQRFSEFKIMFPGASTIRKLCGPKSQQFRCWGETQGNLEMVSCIYASSNLLTSI